LATGAIDQTTAATAMATIAVRMIILRMSPSPRKSSTPATCSTISPPASWFSSSSSYMAAAQPFSLSYLDADPLRGGCPLSCGQAIGASCAMSHAVSAGASSDRRRTISSFALGGGAQTLARFGSSTERVIALRRRIGYALAPGCNVHQNRTHRLASDGEAGSNVCASVVEGRQ
jgi:hypothetical protein